MPIRTHRHVRQKPEAADGTRIVVMRWWPRGVSRESVDCWLRCLAPSEKLLHEYRGMETEPDLLKPMPMSPAERWEWFIERYETEMQEPEAADAILAIRNDHQMGETITLLCACHYCDQCHRSILARLVLGLEVGYHSKR
ncbi:MAG: DUF488 family protein [Alphaproteobacteria bacterium]|nr:DUF488 family protein [Alphaproteobacteria bacterium]